MKYRLRTINAALAVILLFSALGFMPRTVEAGTPTELFFSEYIEGSSYSKALEIYNGTGAAVDLAAGAYNIQMYFNGNVAATLTINLTGTVADGDVFVVAGSNATTPADPAILAQADLVSFDSFFNGDDAVVLRKGTDIIDVIGQIGYDPGSQWGVDLVSTADNTLRRKDTVCQGDPNGSDVFDPALEWDGYELNTFDGLGTHTANCGGTELPIIRINELDSDTPDSTDLLEFVELYDGGFGNTPLDGLVLVFYNGNVDLSYAAYDLDTYSTDANGYFLIGNSGVIPTPSLTFANGFLQNGQDAVALYTGDATSFPNGTAIILENLIDAIVYDTDDADDPGLLPLLNAGQPQVNEAGALNKDIHSNQRCPNGSGGLRNTDTYVQRTPTPGGENYCPLDDAPSVASTVPANGAAGVAKDANIVITFSEAVTVDTGWYDITCDSSSNHPAAVTDANPVFTLDPTVDFSGYETCTVTINKDLVYDDGVPANYMVEDYVFSFTTASVCDDPYTLISAIQGSGEESPYKDQTVTTEGIVTGDFQPGIIQGGSKSGYFIQSLPEAEDTNPATSEGLFIYSTLFDVSVGDHVRISGKVVEYNGMTEISLPTSVLVCSTENTIEPTELALPVSSTSVWENYEGMLVTFPQTLLIAEYFNFDRYGDIVLTTERFMQYTALYEPDQAGYAAWSQELSRNLITLDDGRTAENPDPAIHPNGAVFDLTNLFRGGDTVANVTGNLDYLAGAYRIQPTQGADYTQTNIRPENPDINLGELTVASFNVLNYFITLDDGVNDICSPSGTMECRGADTAEELLRQHNKIVAALATIDADIFGLMEIENESPLGEGDAVEALVNGLNAVVGAGTYDYIKTGAIGTDAIKVALIYKPVSVTPVGNHQILTSTIDPDFVDTLNRPTLAQVFISNSGGDPFVVAVNHLKSKSCPTAGAPGVNPLDFDQQDGAGCWNYTRELAAQAMVNWLDGFADVDNILIIGDLNSYDKEDPISLIKLGPDGVIDTDDDYFDMMHEIQGDEAYGYLYGSQIGYLDYALVNKMFQDNVVDVNFWHINADEPDLIDYDMSFKKDAQDAIYAPDAYRSSDHDPVIITLRLSDFIYYFPLIFN